MFQQSHLFSKHLHSSCVINKNKPILIVPSPYLSVTLHISKRELNTSCQININKKSKKVSLFTFHLSIAFFQSFLTKKSFSFSIFFVHFHPSKTIDMRWEGKFLSIYATESHLPRRHYKRRLLFVHVWQSLLSYEKQA